MWRRSSWPPLPRASPPWLPLPCSRCGCPSPAGGARELPSHPPWPPLPRHQLCLCLPYPRCSGSSPPPDLTTTASATRFLRNRPPCPVYNHRPRPPRPVS
ncbi:hypothetical protein ABZP36_012904 [Zizania latifolia]